jgi:uncharacterized protein YPO0396
VYCVCAFFVSVKPGEGHVEKNLAQARERTAVKIQAESSKRDSVDHSLKSIQQRLDSIRLAIQQDDVGKRMADIETERSLLKKAIDALKPVANRYDGYARRLGLPVYQDAEDFYNNRTYAQQTLPELSKKEKVLNEAISSLTAEYKDFAKQADAIGKDIHDLQDRPSNIPPRVARLREGICDTLQIAEDELPFVGELLQIREDAHTWEGALERLLHSFALELIVPEQLYGSVSRYVNNTNLRGRLVYRRVDITHDYHGQRKNHDADKFAFEKLDIKPNTPYRDWLISMLWKRANYVCCETLSEFQQEDRALTREGQIKHNASRHEKDDRRNLHDLKNYVLGWDNQAKIHQLQDELADLENTIHQVKGQKQQLTQQLADNRLTFSLLDKLLEIEEFHNIHWRDEQTKYDDLRDEYEQLSAEAVHLYQMKAERDELELQYTERNTQRDGIMQELGRLESDFKQYERQYVEVQSKLKSDTMTPEIREILHSIDPIQWDVEVLDFDRVHQTVEGCFIKELRKIENSQGRVENKIAGVISKFKATYPDQSVAFTDGVESLNALEEVYQRIERDALPAYEERFAQMLNKNVIRGMQHFSSQLDKQANDIDRSISELNASLEQIDYGNNTRIRLVSKPSRNQDVRDFRSRLRDCMPNAALNEYRDREDAFYRIKALIEYMNEDPNWVRRVIDVRRWREFTADRIDENGVKVEHYTDSSGKSGGQKAKLAYTILASAIAYQYGIQDQIAGESAFRLVVIDEAFSKLDDDNARFAMELFKQLGLQLLVVTPTQQIHVIEPYVSAYHVVSNNKDGNYSEMRNLNKTEYLEYQQRYQRGSFQV